ncbi:MAG: Uma2 family endonuclease, partial [Fimbriiglobus sp.]
SFRGNARDVVPDIVAEVVSPNDLADELIAKVREYLRGGVRLVWVVYPLAREAHAYWPGANTVRAYLADDDLDAGDVLPGFRTHVGDLFPPVEPTPRPS